MNNLLTFHDHDIYSRAILVALFKECENKTKYFWKAYQLSQIFIRLEYK